jgi:hypothetical protein
MEAEFGGVLVGDPHGRRMTAGRRCDHFTTLAMLTINVLATGRQD